MAVPDMALVPGGRPTDMLLKLETFSFFGAVESSRSDSQGIVQGSQGQSRVKGCMCSTSKSRIEPGLCFIQSQPLRGSDVNCFDTRDLSLNQTPSQQ